jgi:hypothetical protein
MPVERETIVTDGGGGGGSAIGLIVVAVILVLLIAGGITVFRGGFSLGGGTVDVPKVTVTK